MEQKAFSLANFKAAPATTMLGVLGGLTMAVQALPAGQLPNTALGWSQFAMALAFGLFGAFGK